jgi:SAM-dependent methyltransferase
VKIFEVLDLSDPKIHVGRHSIWIPSKEIKVPFQWGGRVQKYQRPHEDSYSLSSIAEEYSAMKYLANLEFAPSVGNWVYFKNVISEHIGGWWCDPLGAYGYEMKDANKIEQPGKFDPYEFWCDPEFEGSEGAWNDIKKPGNVINGFLVDCRRSWWDRIKYKGEVEEMPIYKENKKELLSKILELGQFPFKERKQPYQEFYLGGWQKGAREVVKRARLLGYNPMGDESVLDMGCQLGGFLHLAALNNPNRAMIGLDIQKEYIELARDIARFNSWNICFREMDVEENLSYVIKWIRKIAKQGIDNLLLLSMIKHFKGGLKTLWKIIDQVNAQNAYVETNAIKRGENCKELEGGILDRGGLFLGFSEDRNKRQLFYIPID